MRHNRPLMMMVTGVLFALICGLLLTPAMMTASLSSAAAAVEEAVSWQLTNPTVVSAGQTTQSEEGTLITGYKIQASASASGAAPLQKGRFVLTASIFSPKADMPGQKAGMYYVHGSWSITDGKAPVEARKARHSDAVIKGLLNAELSFNPAKEQGPVDAQVQLPMSPMGGWSRGQGSFSGNEKFAGELTVTLDRLPEAN